MNIKISVDIFDNHTQSIIIAFSLFRVISLILSKNV